MRRACLYSLSATASDRGGRVRSFRNGVEPGLPRTWLLALAGDVLLKKGRKKSLALLYVLLCFFVKFFCLGARLKARLLFCGMRPNRTSSRFLFFLCSSCQGCWANYLCCRVGGTGAVSQFRNLDSPWRVVNGRFVVLHFLFCVVLAFVKRLLNGRRW